MERGLPAVGAAGAAATASAATGAPLALAPARSPRGLTASPLWAPLGALQQPSAWPIAGGRGAGLEGGAAAWRWLSVA